MAAFRPACADNWPQFRGPNASGVASEATLLPDELSLEEHLAWKVAVGKGHSSPVIYDGRIYLTAMEEEKLLTLALDAESGERLWQAAAPYDKLESIHGIGSYATPSVATDGEVVVSFFGSSGLQAYDTAGRVLWRVPMGPFDNSFGAAASPIIAGERIILVQDSDTGSFLAAFDKASGRELWRTSRSDFRRNYCTPVVWSVDGQTQIVVAGTAHVVAYDVATGEQIWTVRGSSRVISSTPVVAEDGNLYVANTGGGTAPPQPAFAALIADNDANANGMLESGELPGSLIKGFFGQFDRDKNGSLDETEYESIRQVLLFAEPVAMKIRPGGRGDITDTHVAWTYRRSLPRNSSPVVYDGHLFMVKDGGVMTSLNADTGELVKQGRLRGTGKFFSSPIVGDGKIFVASENGKLNVLRAAGEWEQLHVVDFGEDILATPAVADGCLFVRTTGQLYCFGRAK